MFWHGHSIRLRRQLRIEGESVLASKLAELYEQLKKLKGGVAPMRDIDE